MRHFSHIRKRTLALCAAAIMLLATSPAATAAEKNYTPIFLAYTNGITDESNPNGVSLRLLGATANGTWYDYDKLPCTVNGKKVDFNNAPLGRVPCQSTVIRAGDTVTLYGTRGKLASTRVSKTLLDGHVIADLGPFRLQDDGPWIATGGTRNAMPRKPSRTVKNKKVTFTVDIDGNGKSDTLTLDQPGSRSLLYNSKKVTLNGRSYSIPSSVPIYSDDTVLFLDVDGDNRLELIVCGATYYVVRLQDRSSKLIHDMGWGDRGSA